MEITAAVVRKFVPVTIVLNSEVEVANVAGALAAYGSANTFAENTLKDIDLGQFYSGNVRKAARKISIELVKAIGGDVAKLEARFQAYKKSDLGQNSHPSTAGSAVVGTADDLASGRTATNFEHNADVAVDDYNPGDCGDPDCDTCNG